MSNVSRAFREAVARDLAKPPQHWLVGREVVEVRPMTRAEMEVEGWDDFRGAPMAIVFDDGSVIYPSQDDEGNGGGAMFGVNKGQTFRV